MEYVHANGQTQHNDSTGTEPPNFGDSYSATCAGVSVEDFGNNFWHGAKIYVGNSTSLSDLQPCGVAGSDKKLSYSDVTDKESAEELIKMGGSVSCPDTIGSSKFVVIHMSKETCEKPILCNVGIFTCHCSSYRATRQNPFAPS